MKLVRWGEERCGEKPGLVDRNGAIRDLSGVIRDIAGPFLAADSLANCARSTRPPCPRCRRHAARPLRRPRAQLHRHRAQLSRPRRRDRLADPGRADPVQQGAVLHRRPERRRDPAQGLGEDRLGGRARHRDRQARLLRPCQRGAGLRSPATASATTCPSASSSSSAAAPGPRARAARPSAPSAVAGHAGRDPRRARSRDVARRRRAADADRLDPHDDLRLPADRVLTVAFHAAGARRRSSPPARPRASAWHEAGPLPEGGEVVTLGIEGLGEQRQTIVAFDDWTAKVSAGQPTN